MLQKDLYPSGRNPDLGDKIQEEAPDKRLLPTLSVTGQKNKQTKKTGIMFAEKSQNLIWENFKSGKPRL